jgi:hypothetical protein
MAAKIEKIACKFIGEFKLATTFFGFAWSINSTSALPSIAVVPATNLVHIVSASER